MTTHHRSRTLVSLLAGFLAATTRSDAQSAAATSVPPRPSEETLLLNPFTVSTSKDTGYAASSTLAGTRLNTSLRDIAAAITVVTPELMGDLGVFTLQEVIGYTVNAEPNPSTFNTANNTVASARIRGARVNNNTQDFFENRLPLDIYNLEQISINRGPNSLLFGVGNPGGTLTGVSKRADFRTRYEVGSSLDRWHGWRASADLNQVLIPDKVALRMALLHRDTDGFQDPGYWKEDRIYLAGTWQISQRRNWNSTLRANWETSQADRVFAELRTAQDQISPWLNSGAPLVTGAQPARPGQTLPLGAVRAFGANQMVVVSGSPTAVPILNWINAARGGLNNVQTRSLSANGPVPYAVNYAGPTRASDQSGYITSFFFEQQLGEHTAIELAYSQSERDLYWVRSNGGSQVFVDVNRTLPNGQPNPNVGQYYTEGVNRLQEQFDLSRQVRLTASHHVDLNKVHRWLGQHRFAGLVSRDFNTFALDDFFEINGTPLTGFSPRLDQAQNRIVRRTYIYQGLGNVWQSGQTFRGVQPINEGGIASRYTLDRALRNDSQTDSLVLGVQSKTLANRLATTFGYRWDDLEGYSLDPVLDDRDARGEVTPWRQIPLIDTPDNTLKNGTFTAGAVLHVLPQLSLQANKSETSSGAGTTQDMYGRSLPASTGTGEDYGIKFSLFGERLTGTLTRYKSSQDNQTISSVQALGPRINNIGMLLNVPILIAVADPRDTQDLVARGYEFEMTFNPSRNWRIAAHASRNESILSNVNSRAARFLEEEVYPLEAQNGAAILPNGRTVAQEITDFRNSIRNSKTAVEGQPSEELREWNGTVLTNYRVTEGRLKGWSIGGNVQYRGKSYIGAIVDPVTNVPDYANPIYGNGKTLVGVHLRYERRIFNRYDWQISLHVKNLFDETDLLEKNASSADGAILSYVAQEPRTWMLASTLRF